MRQATPRPQSWPFQAVIGSLCHAAASAPFANHCNQWPIFINCSLCCPAVDQRKGMRRVHREMPRQVHWDVGISSGFPGCRCPCGTARLPVRAPPFKSPVISMFFFCPEDPCPLLPLQVLRSVVSWRMSEEVGQQMQVAQPATPTTTPIPTYHPTTAPSPPT